MMKHNLAIEALNADKYHDMKVFGKSMLPLIKSGSVLTLKKTDDYEKGDVVMCRIKGRIIDAHKITRIDAKGRYLISNNHGWDNGWTKKIFGRVVKVNGEKFGRKET